MKKLFLISLSILLATIMLGQHNWQPYQSNNVPDNSVQISIELNKRYKENVRLRDVIVHYCKDLEKFELTEYEITSIYEAYENINSWDKRGDYENASSDLLTHFIRVNPIYDKYHPNEKYGLCADLMNDVLQESEYYKGLNFTSLFIKTIWFYYQSSQYYAIVEFNENYRSQEYLTKNRRYIYCGLSQQEVDEFLRNSIETYGDKFHRIIKPNKCSCD
jgi:hypothetical protein